MDTPVGERGVRLSGQGLAKRVRGPIRRVLGEQGMAENGRSFGEIGPRAQGSAAQGFGAGGVAALQGDGPGELAGGDIVGIGLQRGVEQPRGFVGSPGALRGRDPA